MEYFLEAITFFISGALLAKYYAAFLTPRDGRRILAPACFGCAYVLFRYVAEYLLFLSEPANSFLETVVLAALVFCLSFIFFEKSPGNRLFLLVSFFAAQDLCTFITASFGTVITDAFRRGYIDLLMKSVTTTEQLTVYLNVSAVLNSLLYAGIYAALGFITLESVARSFKYKSYRLKPAEILSLILPCFSAFAISHAIRVILFDVYYGGTDIILETPGILFAVSSVFLLLTMIVSVRLFQKSIQLHMEGKNAAVLREQIKQIHTQDSSGIYAELRGLRHDLKNHLSNIGLLARSVAEGNAEAEDDLNKYVGKMDAALETLDFTCGTGNSVTDVVLQQRFYEAKRKHIRFHSDFMFPSELGIDAYDLAVILGNALDNAFEACAAVYEDRRFVRLGSRVRGGMFFIEIENSCAGELRFDSASGLPVSGKTDDGHGLGLFNIRRFARRYFGDIDIQLSEQNGVNVFCLTVMLQRTF